MGEASAARAVRGLPGGPIALPPAVEAEDTDADAGRMQRNGAGLDARKREAIREIVCDMLIAAVAPPTTSGTAESGERRG